ncbi:NADH-quinone oxidoreductase subunit B family protein [Geoglobus sp.]
MISIKLAFYLATGCMGCEMALIDAMPEVYDVLSQHEVVWSAPLFRDSKYSDLENLPDNSIDLAFIEGGVNNEEVERTVRLLRKKSKKIVALGTCAVHGGIPSLSAFHEIGEMLESVFGERIPLKQDVVDGKFRLELPELERQKKLSDIIDVDHYIPGCPPKPEKIGSVLANLDNLEEKWLVSGKSVCSSCPRSPAKEGRGFKKINEIKRITGEIMDVEGCFLENGFLCFGFATAGDCEADCIKASVPCRGCYGPIPESDDFGAEIIDAIVPMLTEDSTESMLSGYPGLPKLLYMYRPSKLVE